MSLCYLTPFLAPLSNISKSACRLRSRHILCRVTVALVCLKLFICELSSAASLRYSCPIKSHLSILAHGTLQSILFAVLPRELDCIPKGLLLAACSRLGSLLFIASVENGTDLKGILITSTGSGLRNGCTMQNPVSVLYRYVYIRQTAL